MAKQAEAALFVELRGRVERLQQDMNTAVGVLTGTQKKIQGVMKGVQTVINAALVVGGIAAVRQFGKELSALAQKGEELGSIEESFRKLGGTSRSIEEARKATIGLVDSFALMKSANAGLVAGIPGFNENFAKIADLGARLANTLGIDTTEAINRVVDALKSGKTQALQQVGILIDVEKVYGKFGDTLTDVEKKALRTAAGIAGLETAISRFAEVTDSVANAQKAVSTAMDEVVARIGIAINNNENLTRAYRELEVEIRKIDWRELGAAAADFFATLMRASNAVFPVLISWINDTVRGFNYLFGDGLQSQADRAASRILELQGAIDELRNSWKPGALLDQALGGGTADALQKQLDEAVQEFKNITGEMEKQKKLQEDIYSHKVDTSAFLPVISEIEKKNKEANERVNKEDEKKKLETSEKVAEEYRREMERAYQESVDFWANAFRNAIDGTSGSLEDSLKDVLVGFASSLAAAVSQGVGAGLDGSPESLGRMLGQSISGGGGFSDLLGSIFTTPNPQGFYGPGGDPSGSGAGQVSGPGAGAYAAAGIQSAIAVFSQAMSAKDIDRQHGDNRGTGGAVGGGIGAGIGAAVGGPAGMMVGQQLGSLAGSLIGSLFGRGATHAQTKAREAFGEFIEDAFKELKTIAFFDTKGKLQQLNAESLNFVVGASGRFNNPDWGASMSEWGDQAKTTFLGLGEALEEVLGITEDVGGQMGFILGDNLAGNIDNARLLVYQLGLSLEEMTDGLVNAGLQGEMRWHEVEVAIQGVTEAFQPGIAAVGSLSGAVDELINSGGRGAAAIKSIKDIAVEAMEAGATTIADIPRIALEQGVSQEMIDAIMTAIESRGIKTLEELAAVSDRVGGGIVADIESNSAAMQEKWKEMSETIKEVTEQLNNLPERLQTDVTIKVRADVTDEAQAAINAINSGGDALDIGTEAFANGGIIASRTRMGNAIAGEAGMEAILPLKSLPNGRLGVESVGGNGRGGGHTIIVNAQGAGPGVEHAIRREIEAMGNMAVSRAIEAMGEMNGRGGRYSEF